MKTAFCTPILLLSLAGLLAGCGGGRVASTPPPATPSPTPPSSCVVIFPPSASLGPNGALGFTAFVNLKSGQGVLWSVVEGDKGGTIDNFGNYVAPATTGLYNVKAVSIADPSQHSEAAVTVLPSGFTVAGGMTTQRAWHSGTLLPDGTVLVTGGVVFVDCIQSPCDEFWHTAEIYSPATRDWAATPGLMLEPRAAHTTTLLQNGQVLLAGGFHEDDSDHVIISATAELFDPPSGSFKSAGSLVQPRFAHTATLLADGRVWIVGGKGAQRSAELYDRATGGFTATGSLAQGRLGHTATLLSSGKVLIVGSATTTRAASVLPLLSSDFSEKYLGRFKGERRDSCGIALSDAWCESHRAPAIFQSVVDKKCC